MEIGMLWFDNDKKSNYEAKIERAAAYYRDKYGKAPNLCFVHPCMVPKNKTPKPEPGNAEKHMKSQGVEIRVSKTMLPNHFWIGINRQESTSAL
ncbi:MAG: hypothetical protein ACYTFW_05130 [Planctomycetota bacterium]|jgi:hypothetical protein